ncbi:interleukin-1 receptor-like 2 isoform X2 [Denticeps clupeoides]|uniref:interleukin-1 receptor-like 2 isoform X2 n=1 Tax=Denticeps clupeoides TaxID=299321 RepID=UPI0010A37E91|nr:interleukin-1 receptor-like 2 isoform X2 [Denticeps clupeoides]
MSTPTTSHGTSKARVKSSQETQAVLCTPQHCFRQATVMQVDSTFLEECGRPQKAFQRLTALTNGFLNCPLKPYKEMVDQYIIKWYKDCNLIEKGGRFLPMDDYLHVKDISPDEAGNYTCVMTFDIAGVRGRVSETIECEIIVEITYLPHVIEPAGDSIKAHLGSSFTTQCQVFVPGTGDHNVEVLWIGLDDFISKNPTARIHQSRLREKKKPDGVILERALSFSEVRKEDLKINFTCLVFSDRGFPQASFTLQPADPDFQFPVGMVLGGVALFFVTGMVMYRLLKIELALWCRSMLPHLYSSKDSDGKLYDAYVTYPHHTGQFGEAVENFALCTLPQLLEGRYGYRLFILGRDGLPGEALVDVVDQKLSLSRRLLLLYSDSCEGVVEVWQRVEQWAEQHMGLHRALVEGTLRVVLIEVGEVRHPSSLPESLRLIRRKQGALRLWRSRRWCGMGAWSREEEVEEQASFTFIYPSARFWRKLRYHMPVRGKAKPTLAQGPTLSLLQTDEGQLG